ncbi:hypothetical protein HYT56_03895 [Candidatus Woesearchaeota archaeon]|nr:hypothetical protein [Candidatus Woesearchaeota archaeon]
MTIQFISPNPEQKKALDELEKLLSILDKEPSKELRQNVRFVKSFTKSLLFAGKNYPSRPRTKRFEKSYEHAELKNFEQEPERKIVTHGEWDKFPRKIILHENLPEAPPLPPAPPAVIPIQNKEAGMNVKGGGINFQDFMLTISKENGILKFNIVEPEMESTDWKIFQQVKNKLKQQIISNPEVLEQESFLINEIKNTCNELNIKYSDSYLKKIKYFLVKYIKGFGKIDPLINNPDVSEIICSSYDDIKVKYKKEILKTNIQFDTNEELDNFIINMADKINLKISEENPALEGIYKNLKVSAFYNPIMGSRFTIIKQ